MCVQPRVSDWFGCFAKEKNAKPDLSAGFTWIIGLERFTQIFIFKTNASTRIPYLAFRVNIEFVERISDSHLHKAIFAMANYLASIFGTEQDKVNCSFYYKIGACRHGDRCSRKHVKPSYSQTILLPNLYQNPAYDPKNKMNASQLQNHFDAFYEDFWCEMCKYGEPEEVVVCDNNNDREYLVRSVISCGKKTSNYLRFCCLEI